jgi:hypothetical protein
LSEHEHRYVFLRQELAVEIEARLQAWRELLGLREDAEAIRQHLNCIPDTSQAQEREPLPGRVYDAVRDLRAALARAEAAESERDALRRIVDSECPIGALDLVTSLRVEKRQIQEALQAEWAKVEAAEAELQAWRSLRPEVQAFALAMEERLKANDHKGTWKGCDTDYLLDRLREEWVELRYAVMARNVFGRDPEQIRHEAADAANFALFIADVCGGLAAKEEPRAES